jgi:hypothetical protein
MITRSHGLALLLGLALLVARSADAGAGQSWICAINMAVECGEDGECGPPDFGSLMPPTFLRVDTGRMEVTLLAPKERQGEITVIDEAQEIDGLWVLTGVEEGRSWSMIINPEGYMTLSVTYDGVTWSAFGNTMGEEDSVERRR